MFFFKHSPQEFFIREAMIRFSNCGTGVCKEHYAYYYEPKSSILFAGNGPVKISSAACRFSPVKIDYSDYLKSFVSRIDEVYFFHKISLWHLLFYDLYCGMLQPFVSLQSNLLLS